MNKYKIRIPYSYTRYGDLIGYCMLNQKRRQEMKRMQEILKIMIMAGRTSTIIAGRKFKRLKQRLGIEERHAYTLKTFKKTFATDLADKGFG